MQQTSRTGESEGTMSLGWTNILLRTDLAALVAKKNETANSLISLKNQIENSLKLLKELKDILGDQSENLLIKALEELVKILESELFLGGKNTNIFDDSVSSLGLSTRLENCLLAQKIKHVGEVVSKHKNDILRTPNLGRRSLEELESKLLFKGLRLGTDVGSWRPPVKENK